MRHRETIVVVDSNAVCHRIKHSKMELIQDGEDIHIIYGFLVQIINLARKFNTSRMVFTWDSGKSLRKEKYSFYKDREPKDRTPQEKEFDRLAYKQFHMIRDYVIPTIGFAHNYLQRKHEADDVIASVVMNNTGPFVVATTDDDLLQLLDYCHIRNFKREETVTKISFKAKYGIEPKQWAEVKRLAGCASDTVPGIRGIGMKKALQWIKGELPKNTKAGKPAKAYQAIANDLSKPPRRSIYHRNGWLVTLPLPSTKRFVVDFSNERLRIEGFKQVCDDFGFNSMLDPNTVAKWKQQFNME